MEPGTEAGRTVAERLLAPIALVPGWYTVEGQLQVRAVLGWCTVFVAGTAADLVGVASD